MKILILSQWFDPENCIKGLAFARELVRHGHDVSVVTGFPNYPGGKVYPGYRISFWRRELMDGVPILRVPLYPSHDRSAIRRILNYCSFALAAAIGIFAVPRPDIVYVYSPPPTTALAAVLLHALKGVPFVLDIQDMWPDTLGATGMVRQRGVMGGIRWWLDKVYARAAKITVLSPGFKRILIERGVAAERIVVIPNWTDEAAYSCANVGSPPDGDNFDIVYAGNLGAAQAMHIVIAAARALRHVAPHVRFLIAGHGIDADRLHADVASDGIDTIIFLGQLPAERMPDLLSKASALLVHLRDDPIFAVTIPSKTQAYLLTGKPILMGVKGDAAMMVLDAEAGLSFEPENAAALADAILQLLALPAETRHAMGRAGSDYYRNHLSLDAGARAFIEVFGQAIAETRS